MRTQLKTSPMQNINPPYRLPETDSFEYTTGYGYWVIVYLSDGTKKVLTIGRIGHGENQRTV
jgi:hypothetical protein